MVDSPGCDETASFAPPTRPPVCSTPKKEPSIELPGSVASPASSVDRGGTYTSSAADRAVAAPTLQLKWLPEQGQADCVFVTVGAEGQEPAHTNTQTPALGPTHPTPTHTNTPPAAAGPTSRSTAPAAPGQPQSHSWTAFRAKLGPETHAERNLEWCPLLRLASGKSVLIAAPDGDMVGSLPFPPSLALAQSRSLPPLFVRRRSRSRSRSRTRRPPWQIT